MSHSQPTTSRSDTFCCRMYTSSHTDRWTDRPQTCQLPIILHAAARSATTEWAEQLSSTAILRSKSSNILNTVKLPNNPDRAWNRFFFTVTMSLSSIHWRVEHIPAFIIEGFWWLNEWTLKPVDRQVALYHTALVEELFAPILIHGLKRGLTRSRNVCISI